MTPRKKIPTKAELQQLQKLYKTDEKIGERLGGVPAYLIAYWRRKKGIPKYSLPKFSEIEVRNLWERFGDDEKAGLELGISKAAFYNWRRRYGIREKPAFLKLEQLELNFPGARSGGNINNLYGQRTLAQKIIAAAAGIDEVSVGDTIEVEPDLVVCTSRADEIFQLFKESGPEFVFNPNKFALGPEGRHTDKCVAVESVAALREFARRQSIRQYFELYQGSPHQLMIERGLVLPGQLVVGSSSMVASDGALGAMAFKLEVQPMAALWSSGKVELEVPATIRIEITGRRYRGVSAKDVFLHIHKELGLNGAEGKVVEYAGSLITQMSISERFALSSMTADLGAVAAICPYDATTRRYLTGRSVNIYKPAMPDRDGVYDEMYQINIDQLLPQVRMPGRELNIRAAAEMEGTTINQVLIGTCSSGRFDDLRLAAEILKGKQVSPEVRLLIFPASRAVYLEALKKGLIRVFVEAGAAIMSPGMIPFQDVAGGLLSKGEKCLATTTATHNDSLGVTDAEIILCSPATAAASSLSGSLVEPTRFLR